jgi:hypothetical protein
LKSEYRQLLGQFPDAEAQLKQLFKVVCDIEDVAGYTPASVGESEQWSSIVNFAEENRQNFCKKLNGRTLFSALNGTYTVALQELKFSSNHMICVTEAMNSGWRLEFKLYSKP